MHSKPDIKIHLASYPEEGINMDKLNDLKGYKRVATKLAAAAGNLATSTETAVVEEHLSSPMMGPNSPILDECGWDSIVKKYNSRTTNHYLNLVISRNLEESNMKQHRNGLILKTDPRRYIDK